MTGVVRAVVTVAVVETSTEEAVMVMVPATVPVRIATLDLPEKVACVDPAVIVKFTLRPPVPNCIVWSSPLEMDAKLRVAVPVISDVAGLAREIVIESCWTSDEVEGRPPIESAGIDAWLASAVGRAGVPVGTTKIRDAAGS